MAVRWNWRAAARCRTGDAEELFVLGARQREASQLCRSCAVRTECLAYALDNRIEFGVWGGMTERERRALLRSRRDVRSWSDLLTDARDAHYASPVPSGASADKNTAATEDETAEGLAVAAERAAADRAASEPRRLHESA